MNELNTNNKNSQDINYNFSDITKHIKDWIIIYFMIGIIFASGYFFGWLYNFKK